MSFAINPSLTHIDIPETNILKLYRSKGQVQLADTRFRNHPCEAFICIYKVDKTVSARVALLETGMNSIFVYTSDFSADQSSEYPKVLAEAQSFTASFGFTMEKINLDFSPAMREVIIKGISVMRPPKKRVKLRSHSSSVLLEMDAPDPAETTAHHPSAAAEMRSSDPTATAGLLTELSAAKTLIEKITREKMVLGQNASREIATLKAAAEKAAESKESCESRLLKEIEALKAEKLATASNQKDELIQQLELSLAAAEASGTALKEEISRLTGKIKIIENEKLQREEQFSAEKSSSAEAILKLTAELESLNALLSAEKSLAADKIAMLALFETSWRESQQREEDLRREIDSMKKQLDRLKADLEKQRRNENNEDALLLKIAALEKEAEGSSRALEQLAGSMPDLPALEAEIKTLKAAKNDVEAEYIRMANEVMEKEAETLENFYIADAEILRLSRELDLQQKIAIMETEALRDELKLLLVSGAALSSPAKTVKQAEVTSEAPSNSTGEESVQQNIAPNAPATSPEATKAGKATAAISPVADKPGLDQIAAEDDSLDRVIASAPEIINGLLNEFGSICGTSNHAPTKFNIDPDTNMIEYSDPAEVLAILYSSNTVQAVPDGSNMQRCKGYVIALKKAGEYRAYLAWYLTESDKVVICNPDQQPADAAECTQILQDAIAYFEIVGFMMEVADLGGTVRSYNSAIGKVPAFVRS